MNKSLSCPYMDICLIHICSLNFLFSRALTYLIPYTRFVPYQVLTAHWSSLNLFQFYHTLCEMREPDLQDTDKLRFMEHSNMGVSSLPFSKIQNFSLFDWHYHWTDIVVQLNYIPKISYLNSNNEIKMKHFTGKIITFPPVFIISRFLSAILRQRNS